MTELRQAVITGVGAIDPCLYPGRTPASLAADAAALALADAGLSKNDLDGLVTCKSGSSGGDVEMGQYLGMNPRYSASLDYGTCNFSIHIAAGAIALGLADHVMLTFGTDRGTTVGSFVEANPNTDDGFVDPSTGISAFMARRHRELYGLTDEQLGWVSVAQRRWADLNPRAIGRGPDSIEEYLAAPYTVFPLRGFDMTPLDDGAVAVVMSAAGIASADGRGVCIAGIGQQTALRRTQNPDNMMRLWAGEASRRALAGAGISREDVDALYIQEPSSMWVIQLLEAAGFCDPGGAGAFVASGATAPGGLLPVNTNGGQLSEGYLWGWLHVVEAVTQLRGEAGARQVPGARTALSLSTMVDLKAAATVFRVGTSE